VKGHHAKMTIQFFFVVRKFQGWTIRVKKCSLSLRIFKYAISTHSVTKFSSRSKIQSWSVDLDLQIFEMSSEDDAFYRNRNMVGIEMLGLKILHPIISSFFNN
jgi:hypothetical protein